MPRYPMAANIFLKKIIEKNVIEFFFLLYNLMLTQEERIWILNIMKTQESANKISKAPGISMIWIGFGQVREEKRRKTVKSKELKKIRTKFY